MIVVDFSVVEVNEEVHLVVEVIFELFIFGSGLILGLFTAWPLIFGVNFATVDETLGLFIIFGVEIGVMTLGLVNEAGVLLRLGNFFNVGVFPVGNEIDLRLEIRLLLLSQILGVFWDAKL